MILGINASRARSGGGVAHLIGVLSALEPRDHGLRKVHIWAFSELLAQLPNPGWLVKHCPPATKQSILWQLVWERFGLPKELRKHQCNTLLNVDAGSVCRFHPSISMSRNMLPYESAERKRYGYSKARLRLWILRVLDAASVRNSDGFIFLTEYASKKIRKSTGNPKHYAVIPHGVSDSFRNIAILRDQPFREKQQIKCLYISNAAPYKHQWHVVKAIELLRKRGYDVFLTLVGGGNGPAQDKLDRQITLSDPNREFVRQDSFVKQSKLVNYLSEADLFVFASSCENMPNTLLEAMAAGLPIACSDRGPMPEVLQDAGSYFDPENPVSIAAAIEKLILNESFRLDCAGKAQELAKAFSWKRTADETLAFISQILTSKSPVRPFQICSNCVMDTTDGLIVFDEKGVCDHCNTFYHRTLPNWHTDARGEVELQSMVEKIRREGEGKDFDCIIGMSGGIDSSYLLYLAVEKLKLRPLVFHVDAGWNSQIAVNNIERLVDELGVDLYTEVIDWEEMKDLQLAFLKSGVPHIDTPQDHAFFATMYKFASQLKVKNILTGANLSTECVRNPIEWMYYQSDSAQLRDIHRRFGRRPLKTFPVTSILWHKLFLPYVKGIRVLRPLNYMPYIKQEAMSLLTERFGWQPYPQKHFESRFTRFYESYWLPKRFGYDVRKVQYSSLILTGQMTRETALERLKQSPWDENTIGQELEFVANKLGISVKELNSYMELPKRTYRDYRSQELIYTAGSRIMKFFDLEVGGKR